VVDELQAEGHEFAARLREASEDPVETSRLGVRPATDDWSALEYACHVRDVLLVQRERLVRTLVEDTPTLVTMHRDHRPRLAGYADSDPARLVTHLEVATGLFVDVAARLDDTAWRRTCVYNHPEPTEVDLAWVAAHTVHELVHHRDDVDRTLARVSAAT
jgi:hypothetical protein